LTWDSDCREVFLPLEGEPQILWNDQPVAMQRLDVLSVAPSVKRAIVAPNDACALLLRIRDLTNQV